MTTVMLMFVSTIIAFLGPLNSAADQKAAAEEFLRGLYGCKPEVVDKLAADDIAVSYPVFQKIFNKPAIRGKADVRAFANRFCSRFKNSELTIEEAVEEGNRVVFLWSFRAESAVDAPGMSPKGTVDTWGGITLFKFDNDGKIAVEVGEESDPGPAARLRAK